MVQLLNLDSVFACFPPKWWEASNIDCKYESVEQAGYRSALKSQIETVFPTDRVWDARLERMRIRRDRRSNESLRG